MTFGQSTGRFNESLLKLRARSYDECQSCGRKLPREVACYAGYDAEGGPLYVGDCCKQLIVELVSHIYWWWENDRRCEPETRLWRYMDFAKFVALLDSRSLHFSRADNLGDVFEGAAGVADRRAEWDAFYLEYFRETVRTTPGRAEPFASEYVEREAARLLKEISLIGERDRRTTFVSCWHANGVESEALWRLYCPPPAIGVAIQTTAALLTDALDDPAIKIGRVQYVDFRKTFAGFHDRIFWKRKSLSHEMEVRAVITRHDGKQAVGVPRAVDIEKMVASVVVSPFAPNWFTPLVKSTMERFGVSLPVVCSELLAEPFF